MNKTKVAEIKKAGLKPHYVMEAFSDEEWRDFKYSKEKRAADAGVPVSSINHDDHIVWLARQHCAQK